MDDVIYSGNGKMVPVEQRDLGMVFQSFALWPNMTVRQHVEFPMKSPKQKHLTEAQKKEAVDAAIENMGLKTGIRENFPVDKGRESLLQEPLWESHPFF